MNEDRAVRSTYQQPDLVLSKGNDILIIDVTFSFENGLEAFKMTRKEKEEKYAEYCFGACYWW